MEITDFLNYKNGNAPILGLDVSKKRIGVAVSNNTLTIAFPKKVIQRTKLIADLQAIQTYINQYNCWGLVVGLPTNSNGSKSIVTQSINQFARQLHKHTALPVIMQDERYSTFFVKQSPALAKPFSKNQNHLIDDQAACWLLQNFLDKINKNAII